MIKHIWSVLCERIITDQQTNLTSYLTALEGISANKLPIVIQNISLGSRWFKDSTNEETLKFRVLLITPDRKEKILIEDDKTFKSPNHRTNIVLNGFPAHQAGAYHFIVQIFQENTWVTVSEIPFIISLQEQPEKI